MRKGHFLPKFGKKYGFIKIYTWRNNYKFQKLCQVIDYNILFKKNEEFNIWLNAIF